MYRKIGSLILILFALAACSPSGKDSPTRVSTVVVEPTPTNTPLAPTPTTNPEIAQEMETYRSLDYPFSIQIPADWDEGPKEQGLTRIWLDEIGTTSLVIAEEDLKEEGIGEISLEEYVEFIIYILDTEDFELESRERTTNSQGLPVQILEFSGGPGGLLRATRMVYLHENWIGFNATYAGFKGNLERLQPWIEFTFSSFDVTG